jgi:hypothetical protein
MSASHNTWKRLRGNASGRNGFGKARPWHCAGCGKVHQGATERTIALDGNSYCNRTYYKMLANRAPKFDHRYEAGAYSAAKSC